MPNITIATFNINSIKARLPNLLAWLDSRPVDVLLLQELKCETDAFPAMELEERGYNLAIHGQKTYNGVAICSKFPLDDVVRGLPTYPPPAGGGSNPNPTDSRGWPSNDLSTPSTSQNDVDPPPAGDGIIDSQARYIEAVASIPGGAIRLASAYVPNGMEVGCEKFLYKLKFLERLRVHWEQQLKFHEIAVLGGDFNVAPEPIDVHDPKAWEGNILFHPEERARLRALMHLGMYDAFRVKHPATQQFSWWDYRGGGYERGHGVRIDHLLLSGPAADKLTAVEVDETPRAQEKPSDHAPVIAVLTI